MVEVILPLRRDRAPGRSFVSSLRRERCRPLPSPRHGPDERRRELERELCEKLGMVEAPEPSPRRPRPLSGGPSRPPKPKPHRPLLEAAAPPACVEELPTVRRWRSAMWHEGRGSPEPPAAGAELSRTAPAALSEPAPEAPGAAAETASPRPPGDELQKAGNEGPTVGAKLLEESSRRLRENLQRLRRENRRHRVQPVVADEPLAAVGVKKLKHLEELRRRVDELEEARKLEEQKLEMELKENQERREKQEAFERAMQEEMERWLREREEREAREAEEQLAQEEEARQQLEERQSRWRLRQELEELRSRRLEEQRLGKGPLEPVVWADQQAEERKRVEDYARDRFRQYEEWEKHFAAERLRFASEAEFCAAKLRQQARAAAQADEEFYAWQRGPREKASEVSDTELPRAGDGLAPEERQVLKELRSVLGLPREAQRAKLKELLMRLHPDKNPQQADKAKQLFQFLQEQRQKLLGL